MNTLENLLSPLCVAIREKTYKSKQAAFNVYLDNVMIAKELYSWVQIADYLNANTNSDVGFMSYKQIIARSKRNKIKNEKGVVIKEKTALSKISTDPINPLKKLSKNTSDEYNPTPDKSRIYGDD
ncbi:hypothetical protein LOV73_004649 [Salmonella enterica]|nr:hypothetical protein [Salmonella enterica]